MAIFFITDYFMLAKKFLCDIIHFRLVYKNFPARSETAPKSKEEVYFVRKYEVVFIVKSLDEEATNAVIEKFSKLIAANGGTID